MTCHQWQKIVVAIAATAFIAGLILIWQMSGQYWRGQRDGTVETLYQVGSAQVLGSIDKSEQLKRQMLYDMRTLIEHDPVYSQQSLFNYIVRLQDDNARLRQENANLQQDNLILSRQVRPTPSPVTPIMPGGGN